MVLTLSRNLRCVGHCGSFDKGRPRITFRDPKTRLQEHAQKHKRPLPTYETIRKTGPDHDPTITVQAHYGDRTANATAKGMHPSKRAASMAAAKILAELEAEARKGRRKKK